MLGVIEKKKQHVMGYDFDEYEIKEKNRIPRLGS